MLCKFTRTNVIHAGIYLYINDYEFEIVAISYDLTVSVKLTVELISNVTVYTLNFAAMNQGPWWLKSDVKFNLMTKATAVFNM